MNLLTEHSRKIWLAWKASSSFNWRPGIDSPEWKEHISAIFDGDEKQIAYAQQVIAHPKTGTIPCMAVDANGDISATTTTSGLSWKIPGRVGDSPIIGAGCCVDNEVGAAGSTGKGEENIKISGGHTIIEMMRQGKSPTDACLEAMGRVARNYKNDKKKLGTFTFTSTRSTRTGRTAPLRCGAMDMKPANRQLTRCTTEARRGWLLARLTLTPSAGINS